MERVLLVTLLTLMATASPGHCRKIENATYGVSRRNEAAVDQLLMQIERDWARAIIARDATRIREIVAPEAVLTTPEGTVLNRDDDITELLAGEFTAESYDAVDMRVRLYGDCAVI